MKGSIALEDGLVLEGESFGAEGRRAGEAVFNTSMTGYQEVLTDPSYKGQIVAMTYPLIGNYGVNPGDVESAYPKVEGFVVREHCPYPSNGASRGRLDDYLLQHGIIAVSGVVLDAFSTIVFPVEIQSGIIQPMGIMAGKFHGAMPTNTPIGSR